MQDGFRLSGIPDKTTHKGMLSGDGLIARFAVVQVSQDLRKDVGIIAQIVEYLPRSVVTCMTLEPRSAFCLSRIPSPTLTTPPSRGYVQRC